MPKTALEKLIAAIKIREAFVNKRFEHITEEQVKELGDQYDKDDFYDFFATDYKNKSDYEPDKNKLDEFIERCFINPAYQAITRQNDIPSPAVKYPVVLNAFLKMEKDDMDHLITRAYLENKCEAIGVEVKHEKEKQAEIAKKKMEEERVDLRKREENIADARAALDNKDNRNLLMDDDVVDQAIYEQQAEKLKNQIHQMRADLKKTNSIWSHDTEYTIQMRDAVKKLDEFLQKGVKIGEYGNGIKELNDLVDKVKETTEAYLTEKLVQLEEEHNTRREDRSWVAYRMHCLVSDKTVPKDTPTNKENFFKKVEERNEFMQKNKRLEEVQEKKRQAEAKKQAKKNQKNTKRKESLGMNQGDELLPKGFV